MKCVSLWQPWASLMVMGAKRYETRSWFTRHRGELAIHASKRKMGGELKGNPYYNKAVGHCFFFPYGCIVGVVTVLDCIQVANFHGATPLEISEMEVAFGDYTPGRFAWLTHSPRKLRNPIPVRGRQGLWNLDAQMEWKVREQLLW